MSDAPAIVTAIQGVDAAMYAYGVIGAHTRGADAARARKALDLAQRWRADLQALATEQVGAASAYTLPFPVSDAVSARRLGAVVDDRLTAVLADAAAATSGSSRRGIVAAAMQCAARAVVWGGPPMAFPHG